MFYRLRQAFHYTRFKYLTGILSSPPIACEPDSHCAIHTMLGARDFPLYLAAAKSFLHYCPEVAIVVHSDGSLTRADESALAYHIEGCRVITAAAADAHAEKTMDKASRLYECRKWDASWRRVIDTELWCRTPQRIIMDSDILTLRPPEQVAAWIKTQADVPFMLGQPPASLALPPAINGHKHIQTIFRENVPTMSRRLGLTDQFPQGATSGFYGCGRQHLSLEVLERLVRVCFDVGIPMREWGSEQCVVIYLLASAGCIRLSPEHYINFDFDQVETLRNAHVVHFLGFCRFYKNIYGNYATQMVRDLRRLYKAAV